jgi:hypothetical protein
MTMHGNYKNRLSLVLWGSAVLANILLIIGVGVFHHLTLKQRAQRIMEPYVQMIAVGTDAAVAFEDPVRAKEILDTLERNPHILRAEIVLDNGVVLAGFGTMSITLPQPWNALQDGVYISDESVVLLRALLQTDQG